MAYTLGQAASAASVSKTTIRRAIKRGRLSATRQPDGSYEIDPAELHRAFPSPGDGSGTMARSVTASDTGELRIEVEMLRERLVEKDDVIGDLRRRLDQSGGGAAPGAGAANRSADRSAASPATEVVAVGVRPRRKDAGLL